MVLEESRFPKELTTTFKNLENNSNPWGIGASERESWTEGLDIKRMRDINEEVDVLLWVGCAGAFDDRSKKITRDLVKILQTANVKFGILGNEENCTGDSARRAGNEYLFQKGLIKRKVLDEKTYGKYMRVLCLTEQSQKAIAWFEKQGKRIRSEKVLVGSESNLRLSYLYDVTDRELTLKAKLAMIRRALSLLEQTGKKGFELLNTTDLNKYKSSYEKIGKEKTANKTLSEVLCFFVNLKKADFLAVNPFDEIAVDNDSSIRAAVVYAPRGVIIALAPASGGGKIGNH